MFLATAAELAADDVTLAGAEGRHAAAVRRLRRGEPLVLTDGAGLRASAEVLEVRRDALRVRVLARERVPAPVPRLVVVQALAKAGRDLDAVAAMTEAGVDEVVPWAAARSLARWGPRSGERWALTAREAAKQARRVWLPTVAEPAQTPSVAARLRTAALAVVLHEAAGEPLARLAVPAYGDLVVVVGPEGGIDAGELDAFTAAGARPVRLGPTVLRTSTAGVAALAVLSAATGRWG